MNYQATLLTTSSSVGRESLLQSQMSSDDLQHVNADLVMTSERCYFESDHVPLVVQGSQMSVNSNVGVSSGQVARVFLKNRGFC